MIGQLQLLLSDWSLTCTMMIGPPFLKRRGLNKENSLVYQISTLSRKYLSRVLSLMSLFLSNQEGSPPRSLSASMKGPGLRITSNPSTWAVIGQFIVK